MKNDKCKKCRYLFPNMGFGDLTESNNDVLGTCSSPYVEFVEITPCDETIEYNKCVDFVPLAHFEDEELEKSLQDNESEVMSFE